MRAAPRLLSALVGRCYRPSTSAETSGHALRRTTEDENWGGAQTGGPRIQGYPGGRSLSGRIFEGVRSEEHTSELQSLRHLVCRLLLEKKKINSTNKLSG